METKEKKYHSETEKRLVEDIIKVDLNKSKEELDNRIVIQHRDSVTGIDCFNVFSKNVLVRDDNGKRIVINNRDEIKKIKTINNTVNKKETEVIESKTSTDEEDVIFDD